jgi:hypothetical protein
VHFPDGRREDFTVHPSGDPAEGKLATITEVGVDGSTARVWTDGWRVVTTWQSPRRNLCTGEQQDHGFSR